MKKNEKLSAAHVQVKGAYIETTFYRNGQYVGAIFNKPKMSPVVPRELPKGSTWYKRLVSSSM